MERKNQTNQSYATVRWKMGEVWKRELQRTSEGDKNRKSEKNCLGNENTKAEVQVVGVKQCHDREQWRCAGRNDSRFISVDSKYTCEREEEAI